MCVICLAIQKEHLSHIEAKNALFELIKTDLIDSEHVSKVVDLIEKTFEEDINEEHERGDR